MGPGYHAQLEALSAAYDVVVIDSPPGTLEPQRTALMVADVAILPCGPGATDVWALTETLTLVRQARGIRPELDVAVLLTRIDNRTAIADQAVELLGQLDIDMLTSRLGFRVAYQESPSAGVGVTRYQPSGRAAEEVKALVDELETRRADRG